MTCILVLAMMALAISRLTLAQTSGTIAASATTQAPAPTHSTFEIDVIFPRANETYPYTGGLLPIVFAFPNLNAVSELGPFTLDWGIMPWGTLSYPSPGGVYEEEEQMHRLPIDPEDVATFTNSDGSHIFINSTNTSNWDHKPSRHVEPSIYALKWILSWEQERHDTGSINQDCNQVAIGDHLLFYFEPRRAGFETRYLEASALGNVTGNCAQLGMAAEIDVDAKVVCTLGSTVAIGLLLSNKNCSEIKLDAEGTCPMSSNPLGSTIGNPCAVKLDAARVSSISSQVTDLAMAASTSTTGLHRSFFWTDNAAAPTMMPMPMPSVLAAVGVFVGFELWPL